MMEPHQITTITQLTLPPEESLPNGENIHRASMQESWAPHLKSLLKAKGHVASWIGRVKEGEGEEVVLVTDWYPHTAFARFQSSSSYEALNAFLASKSKTPPMTQTLALSSSQFHSPQIEPVGPIELTKVFFAPDEFASPALRKSLMDTRGLAHWHHVHHPQSHHHSHPSSLSTAAYTSVPNKGFPEEKEPWHGCEVNSFIFVNYWRSKEMEERFKAEGKEVFESRRYGKIHREAKKVYDVWSDRMVELGALGWRSQHVTPRRVRAGWFWSGDRSSASVSGGAIEATMAETESRGAASSVLITSAASETTGGSERSSLAGNDESRASSIVSGTERMSVDVGREGVRADAVVDSAGNIARDNSSK